jgi:hypothetical protein
MAALIIASAISGLDLSRVVLAVGGLGTAAYGVVDATKAFRGGISNRGFGDIKNVVSKLLPPAGGGALTLSAVLATLRANWLNGVALPDQKSIAKTLIKLNLDIGSAAAMAAATSVNAGLLGSIAAKLANGAALTPPETDAYGRFDLALASLLDQGYQRADQRYRNSAKLAAIPVAVVLALLGAWALGQGVLNPTDALRALVTGLLATPLAPVAKDVSSAIQAGAAVAQSWRK